MGYNWTAITNTNTTLGLIQNVNEHLMYGVLGSLWLGIIFTISLIAFYQVTGDIGKSLSTSCFISMILSIILLVAGMVPPFIVYLTVIGTAVSLAFVWSSQ